VEIEQRGAEERFQSLFGDSPVGHAITTEGRILDCNDALVRLLGYTSKAELLDLSICELSPPSQPDGRRSDEKAATMEVLARSNGGHSFEWWHRRRDGSVFPAEVSLTPSLLNGKPVMVVVIHDISDPQTYEHLLERVIAADESANQVKNDFLANMSHQIRTLLDGVQSTVGLLFESSLTSEQHRMVSAIRFSGQFLTSMVNDVLDVSMVEAGRTSIKPVAFDLRLVIENVVALLEPEAEAKGIDMVFRYSPQLPRVVVGDSGRIRQIVLNLADNAVKFTSRGHVLIDVGRGEQRGEGCLLRGRVEDTGIGIPADRRANLFTRRGEMNHAVTHERGGAGLGLPISRHLIELMGGRIWCDSTPGVGTTMWFEIPLAREVEEWHELALPAKAVGKIALLVDSCALRRRVLRERLESWGLAVEEAEGENAARELVSSRGLTPVVALVATAANPDWRSLGGWLRRHCGQNLLLLLALAPLTAFPDHAEIEEAGYTEAIPQCAHQAKLQELLTIAFSRTGSSCGLVPQGATDHARCPFACRILLADDNSGDLSVAASLMERMGCHLDIVSNGREAIDLVRQSPYDLVLLDLNMPTMDGFETARQLRLRYGPARLAIVGLTTDLTEEVRQRAHQVGCTAVASKPLKEDALRTSCLWKFAESGKAAYDRQAVQHCEDEQMLHKLAHQFRGAATRLISKLRASVEQYDDAEVAAKILSRQSKKLRFPTE